MRPYLLGVATPLLLWFALALLAPWPNRWERTR